MPTIPPGAVVRLLSGVRVKEDRVRGVTVLLAPERTLRLDGVGAAILSETDGTRPFSEVVDRLSRRFDAPPERIAADAGVFLATLIDRRMAELRP